MTIEVCTIYSCLSYSSGEDDHTELTSALKIFDNGPLSPHYEAKQKVRENLWDMYFTDNGW